MTNILFSLDIILPILFVLGFGYSVEKFNLFENSVQSLNTINRLVLKCTLPATLFTATVTINKQVLYQEFNLFFALLISSLIAYTISFFIIKYFFKRNITECAIAALMISFSAGPLYGPALLESLYGHQGDAAVSMMSLVINVFLLPIASIIIKVNNESKSNENKESVFKLIMHSLYHAIIQTPFVTAPLIAILLVLTNIPVPPIIIKSLSLIGKGSAGLSIFVAGMTIAINHFQINKEVIFICLLKNIAIPLLFICIAPYMNLKMSSPLFHQGLYLMALPSGPIIVALATQYNGYQKEASSALALSTVGMLVSVTIFLTIMH